MIIILLNRKLIDVIEFPSLFKNLTDHSKIKTLVYFPAMITHSLY